MKKIINLGQKPQAEYSCQECHINEAVLKIQGSVECFILKVNSVGLVPLGELKIGVARILLAMNQV